MPIELIAIVFGAIVGSFLNVCIFRIPEGKSIVYPGSSCRKCQAPVLWYHNIPVFSFLFLRGKCAQCEVKLAWQYPIVEIISAFNAWLLLHYFGLQWYTVVLLVLNSALIVITVIDLHHRIIPNIISLPGIPLGIAASFLIPHISFKESLLGALIGGGILYAVAYIYFALRKVEGMGMGDVKLLGMIGAFLGWRSLLFVVGVSSLSGATIGILLMLWKGKDMQYAIPFGPFLALGAMLYPFFGSRFYQLLGV